LARLDNPIVMRAAAVESTFRVRDGLYLLGALERGVTLYNQQVRAHNLVWALWELDRAKRRKLGRVAIIGAGAAGLTAAAGLLARYHGAVPITMFEQRWDLCPLQQGSDTRWLHPRIYGWPEPGSRAPTASLPLLNWSEGRASDVARTLVAAFGEFCSEFADRPESLHLLIGLQHLKLRAKALEIEWVGTRAERVGQFFRRTAPEGNGAAFDTIIVAAGFGLEQSPSSFHTASYWRNEQIGQPILSGSERKYIISGYGDGALVDLCRVRIERFRQDTVLYELFGSKLDAIEVRLHADLAGMDVKTNLFSYFKSIEPDILAEPLSLLASRIRKDTTVVLHIKGKSGTVTSVSDIFGATSSCLNRLLTYLLHRCGAFTTSVLDLATCARDSGIPFDAILCRHGTDRKGHLRAMISDYAEVETRVEEMDASQAQSGARLWQPGAFPMTVKGTQR
jgi:hypothetical protein